MSSGAPTPLPIRLAPGADLRAALEQLLPAHGEAAFVLAGIGSLECAMLRLAGADTASTIAGPLEILTLAGTLATNGAHLHITLADHAGRVCGGHLLHGSLVRTTAEVLVSCLPGHRFRREPHASTGYAELEIAPRR